MGEYEKAKDFYERAMKIETKAFGPDHVNIATTYSNLGTVYSKMGEYEKAKDFYERAIEIETKAFGPDHVNIAIRYNNLGSVYSKMGEYEKAKDFYERAIEIETKAFGPDHVNIAIRYSNLGSVYSKMGEYEKAKELGSCVCDPSLINYNAHRFLSAVNKMSKTSEKDSKEAPTPSEVGSPPLPNVKSSYSVLDNEQKSEGKPSESSSASCSKSSSNNH
ncbi:kinesin light chain 1-like [Xenia sp. Carnegie-2017]|uniref:kinesin light chain 1-like n=1 Tax=Xenia sp. Carnegie-2017 TaxID=2897299 RepID=UPI001F034811|nr:kinesin light chain 1-like [Xenia sp. Carnegie-2017]